MTNTLDYAVYWIVVGMLRVTGGLVGGHRASWSVEPIHPLRWYQSRFGRTHVPLQAR